MKHLTVLCCLLLASCAWTRGLEKPVTYAAEQTPAFAGALWVLPADEHKQTRMIVRLLQDTGAFSGGVHEWHALNEAGEPGDLFLEAKITGVYTLPTAANLMNELVTFTFLVTYPWLGRVIDAEHRLSAKVWHFRYPVIDPADDLAPREPIIQHTAVAKRRFETSLYGTGTEVYDQAEELQTQELLSGMVKAMIGESGGLKK